MSNKNLIRISFGLTNARSLWQKMDCLYDYFDNLSMSFVIVTETWFHECEAFGVLQTNAKHGHNLHMINRTRKKLNKSCVGGGVSIIFNKSKVTLKEFTVKRKGHEIVCARGKMQNNTRPIFILGVYISTKYKAAQYHDCLSTLSEAILKIKTEAKDPYIILGGDFNHRNVTEAIGDYPDMKIVDTAPTLSLIHI